MAFITGSLLIDAPASALNNSGERIEGARTDNTVAVKFLRAQDRKTYPYVSGQAVRYWLRDTFERNPDIEWKVSPTYRGDKVSFSDANPIHYWDDDLLGYMRAPSEKDNKSTNETRSDLTPLELNEKGKPVTVTRTSPFRVGTLVAIAPTELNVDFGTMTRTEGDPVPYEHQFYSGFFHSLFSLDMARAGTFTTSRRSGQQNLDAVRRELAERENLIKLEGIEPVVYQLPSEKRQQRIASLMKALGRLQGGAKQAVHYTDVSPVIAVCAVVRGGNHPFNYLFEMSRSQSGLVFKTDVLFDVIDDLKKNNLLLSPVYVAWKLGFMQVERSDLQAQANERNIIVDTPVSVFNQLAQFVLDNPNILDA